MTVALAQALIKLASVTPDDAGCQRLIAERLEKIGGKAVHLRFEDVDNLWLSHGGGDPVLASVCPPARWKTGTAIPLRRNCATATCTGAARRT